MWTQASDQHYNLYKEQPIQTLIDLGYCEYPLSGVPYSKHWQRDDFDMRYHEDQEFSSWIGQLS